jgi:hypothetical protein
MDNRVAIRGGYSFVPDRSGDSTRLEQSERIAESLGQASLRRLDPLSQYAIYAVHQARQAIGIAEDDRAEFGVQSGVCVATALGAQSTRIRYARRLMLHGLSATNPIDFPDSIDGAPAAHIAIRWGLRGPSLTFADGKGSSVNALVAACRLVASGAIERMYVVMGDAFDPFISEALAKSFFVPKLGTMSASSDASSTSLMPSDVVLSLILQRLDETSIDELPVEVVGFHGSSRTTLEWGLDGFVRDVSSQNKEESPIDLSGAATIAGAWHGVTAPMCKNERSCQDNAMKVRGYRCGLNDARFPNLAFQRFVR